MNKFGKPIAKPKTRQLLPMLLTLLVLALVNSCASGPPAVASVTVSPNPNTVLVSGTKAFSAVAKDASGNVVSASFVWASSNPSIATVEASTGMATGVAVGSASVTATVGSVSGSASLNVTQADPPPPPPGPPGPPPPPVDTTSPTIVSISPNNGEIGVAKNAKIVVEFSEAMNRQATELAYQSADMSAVSFAWSKGDTRLEIVPATDLEYTEAGKVYSFKLTNTATDLAGNKLTAITSSFTTLRELTRTLKSVAALDGDVRGDGDVDTTELISVGDSSAASDEQYKGFLSFNLSPLENAGLTVAGRITSAVLRVYQGGPIDGNPYLDLQANGKYLITAHVNYGPTLDDTDINTQILHDLGQIAGNSVLEYKVKPNALESVRDDWNSRVARENRSQFMLYFTLATDNDGNADIARFDGGESASNPPELEVKFLVP